MARTRHPRTGPSPDRTGTGKAIVYRLFNRLGDSERVEIDVALRSEQRQLLRLMAQGLPDAAIARRLSLGPRTLARRISDLYSLLGVDTRFQAGVTAERLGLLDPPAERNNVA
jgi:DNA-binding NarL/FixJ family response regulator